MVLASTLFLFGSQALPALSSDQPKISVTVNGAKIDFTDQQPYITNNRTMVPIIFISQALGAQVKWDNPYVTITEGDDRRVQLEIGDRVAIVNGGQTLLDAATEITGGRTMVPLSFVGQALGADVSWDAEKYTVVITKI